MHTLIRFFATSAIFMTVCTAQAAITVYRDGDDFLAKSRFSNEQDIVIRISRIANEESYLVDKNSNILDYAKGLKLHSNLDEYPASMLRNYGTLSGNHGSAFGRTVTIPKHGLTRQDIGRELSDERKNRYCVVSVVDADHLFMHPVNKGIPGRPGFASFQGGKLFCEGNELTVTESKMTQMYPLNRIYRLEFLMDGTTLLPDKTIRQCQFLDHILVHDVTQPEAVIDWIRKNPGRETFPALQGNWCMQKMDASPELAEYAALPALMHIENRYRYQDRACAVLYRKTTFPVNLVQVKQFEMMFGWGNGAIVAAPLLDFYIPKLKPLRIPVINNQEQFLEADFSAVWRMPEIMNVSYNIARDDYLDPADPPDRFIRLTGTEKREYGIALGFSLFSGCTAKENQGRHRDEAYFLYRSKKMYPYGFILNDVPPGTVMESVSYKQYFSPDDDAEATSFYFHQQQDSVIVYFDCHKPLLQHRLQLPASLTGKKVAILEKSESVVLPDQLSVFPQEGILFDVKSNYGYLVLKID